MSFAEFLQDQRRRLVIEYMLSRWYPESYEPTAPDPEALLDEDDLDDLRGRLRAYMPRDSMIVTLWDWDVQFQDLLGDDWFFAAALGDDDSTEQCADELAEFFLARADEYGIELGLDPGSEVEAASMVADEATSFVEGWREAIVNRLTQGRVPDVDPG